MNVVVAVVVLLLQNGYELQSEYGPAAAMGHFIFCLD